MRYEPTKLRHAAAQGPYTDQDGERLTEGAVGADSRNDLNACLRGHGWMSKMYDPPVAKMAAHSLVRSSQRVRRSCLAALASCGSAMPCRRNSQKAHAR